MPGPGSQEPHIVKAGRKVPLRAAEPARFEPLPFDRDRPAQPLSTRVRVFPARASTSTPTRNNDVTSDAAVPEARANETVRAAPAPGGRKREAEAPQTTEAAPRTQAFSRYPDNLPRSALHVAERAARLTWDATIILVFSPVIAVWWLLERRHRKGGR